MKNFIFLALLLMLSACASTVKKTASAAARTPSTSGYHNVVFCNARITGGPRESYMILDLESPWITFLPSLNIGYMKCDEKDCQIEVRYPLDKSGHFNLAFEHSERGRNPLKFKAYFQDVVDSDSRHVTQINIHDFALPIEMRYETEEFPCTDPSKLPKNPSEYVYGRSK